MTRSREPLAGSVTPPSRRRVLTMIGTFAGLPLLSGAADTSARARLYQWTGTSLGSPSRLLLYHDDRHAAAEIIDRCVAEIERLERIFALYREESEIVRLNREGRLAAPSQDLLLVLAHCQRLSLLSDGAFDVSVQPLWNLYAAHFFGVAAPAPEGPAPSAIERALGLVDWRGVDLGADRVRLARRGMGLTLNGIAQGYLTDRITDILRDHGCDRVLADMGRSEMRAFGRHADGAAWRVGLADPRRPDNVIRTLDLTDRALCTSGGYGTPFEPTLHHHHLFDPRTGTSAHHHLAVSVLAPSAMIADALSTALYIVPLESARRLLREFPRTEALVTSADGTMSRLMS
ncbi:MAG TPA: FAD:protein FMN transferase [Stellaceae bacterium]|nr:FAD:protein FMN transferase [Stellaceae bacterium]